MQHSHIGIANAAFIAIFSVGQHQAERDLRPAKTQQKISGRLRSEKTTRDRYAIRGYASTAAKHGIATFTAIYAALAGNPWIPPVPDRA